MKMRIMKNLLPGKFRVCLDLGSTHIKIAGVKCQGQTYQLLFYEVVDLVKNYSIGALDQIDDERYIEELEILVHKYHLKNRKVYATLPAKEAIIHRLKLNVSGNEENLSEIILKEFEKLSVEPVADLKIACQYFTEGEEPNRISLLACGIPQAVVDRYERILRRCKLRVSVLDLDVIGVYNAFYFFCKSVASLPVTLVHIGAQSTVCIFMHPTKTPFFHVIKLGGATLTIRIAQEHGIKYCKAEELKRRMYQSKWMSTPSYQHSILNEIMVDFANELTSEVKRCLRHYQSNEGFGAIKQIYLSGGGARMAFISKLLRDHLAVECKIWNPLEYFVNQSPEQGDDMRRKMGVYLTPAIGTLLRGD